MTLIISHPSEDETGGRNQGSGYVRQRTLGRGIIPKPNFIYDEGLPVTEWTCPTIQVRTGN